MSPLYPIYKKVNFENFVGYMDEAGNTVIPPTYNSGTGFSDGLAFLNKSAENSDDGLNYIMNSKGEIIHKFEKIVPMGGFQEGIGHGFREDGEMNFLLFNTKGDIVHEFPKTIHVHESASEGKMILAKKNGIDEGYLFAFFDLETKTMTEFIYEDYISSFNEGIAFAYNNQQSEKGTYFIDHNYNEIQTVPCYNLHNASYFHNGIAPVRSKDKKTRHGLVQFYINNKGEVAFEGDFKQANPCIDGHAIVEFQSGEYAGIDHKGNRLFTTSEYYIHGTFYSGLALCLKDNKAGLIDINGNLLFPMKYNNVYPFGDSNLTIAVLNQEKFYINKAGEIIAPLFQ